MIPTTTSYTTCPLYEATCGLEIATRGREVISIRGDAQDVFSQYTPWLGAQPSWDKDARYHRTCRCQIPYG
jgi:hypothetical protein